MAIVQYKPQLKINDAEVGVTGFQLRAPAGTLGYQLEAELASYNQAVDQGDALDFKFGRINGAGAFKKTSYIKNGRVIGFQKGIAFAADATAVSGLNQIAEKYTKAPRRPIILFDPDKTVVEDRELDSGVSDEAGQPIRGERVAIRGLDLLQLLRLVYVDKCGFADVFTNLPNYRMPRVDFPLTSSFHAVATGYYGLFNPVVFEDDNRLFIVDGRGPLPSGMAAAMRKLRLRHYTSAGRTKPDQNIVNAVLVSYRETAAQSFSDGQPPTSQRLEQDVQDAGTPFTDGWQRTITNRYIAQIYDDPDNPSRVTFEVVWKIESRTQGKDENGIIRELVVETQTDDYSNSWRLKEGYTKTVQIWADRPGSSPTMQQALTESNQIVWRASPFAPGEYIKVWSRTNTSGLVLVEGEGADQVKTPLIEASRNGTIPEDDSATIEGPLPISSIVEYWRDTGSEQIEVQIQKIDHLTRRVEQTKTVQHVGTNTVRTRNQEVVRQVLVRDTASEAVYQERAPLTFDAGYLPAAEATRLARRQLDDAKDPPETVQAELLDWDAGLRRGSLRQVEMRDGSFKTVLVTGWQLTGRDLGGPGFSYVQTIEGIVLV